jgi:acetyl-CoA C-acetyltransferase
VRDAVICEPLRTPIGRYGGALRDAQATELGTAIVRSILDRTGLDGAVVDEVMFGQCYPSSEAPALGRVIALDAGLPVTTCGTQVDRRCGSGLQAVLDAVMQVQTGAADVIIAGGAESMSNAPLYTVEGRRGLAGPSLTLHDALARGRVTAGGKRYPVQGGMLETAENLRREYGIGRAEQDALALRSQQRAAAAVADGRFDAEIVPVTVGSGKRESTVFFDEHPRPDVTIETLAALKPIYGSVDPDATVTAGNASGQNDGAAACVVTCAEKALDLGLRPVARVVTWARAGVEPQRMGISPVAATSKALTKAGLALSDMELIELNEAFAVQVLACGREWQLSDEDWNRINVNGSGISLGHPVGATGARMLATLVREMSRREAVHGLLTMCIGGGQGLAAVLELL